MARAIGTAPRRPAQQMNIRSPELKGYATAEVHHDQPHKLHHQKQQKSHPGRVHHILRSNDQSHAKEQEQLSHFGVARMRFLQYCLIQAVAVAQHQPCVSRQRGLPPSRDVPPLSTIRSARLTTGSIEAWFRPMRVPRS